MLKHYPESGHNGKILQALAMDYYDDLAEEGVTEKQFCIAIKTSRKRCKFFPKISDLLGFVCEYRANPPIPAPVSRQLPDRPIGVTKEQAELNKKRCAVLAKIAAGELSYENGTRDLEAMEEPQCQPG